ncbi:MAG TPA: hypothetical protein VHE12_03195 [bacterium]|nr:hypothetical protein [bacterium]
MQLLKRLQFWIKPLSDQSALAEYGAPVEPKKLELLLVQSEQF